MISGVVDCGLPIEKGFLRNKNVLVTGGADGIGAGLARSLADAGAFVTIGDMNTVKGLALEKEMKEQKLRFQFVEMDVTCWQSQVEAFKCAASFGINKSLDIVFLNAGIAVPSILTNTANSTVHELRTTETIDPSLRVYDVNLLGVVRGISLSIHHLKDPRENLSASQSQERKSIVLTGSLASYLASPMSETYGSSKFGLRGLFKSLRESLPDLGIRINMIAPTYVRTSLMAPVIAKVEAQGIKLTEVPVVVEAMMRLACDSSINGRCIGIGPTKSFDFGDDFVGHDGFLALQEFIKTGALGQKQLEAMQLAGTKL